MIEISAGLIGRTALHRKDGGQKESVRRHPIVVVDFDFRQTLIVDRINFVDEVWLDQEAHPHSDKLHVIERYRRPDLGHLEAEVTVEDPGVLARAYTFKRVAELAPTEEIREFICNENNSDLQHLVGQ